MKRSAVVGIEVASTQECSSACNFMASVQQASGFKPYCRLSKEILIENGMYSNRTEACKAAEKSAMGFPTLVQIKSIPDSEADKHKEDKMVAKPTDSQVNNPSEKIYYESTYFKFKSDADAGNYYATIPRSLSFCCKNCGFSMKDHLPTLGGYLCVKQVNTSPVTVTPEQPESNFSKFSLEELLQIIGKGISKACFDAWASSAKEALTELSKRLSTKDQAELECKIVLEESKNVWAPVNRTSLFTTRCNNCGLGKDYHHKVSNLCFHPPGHLSKKRVTEPTSAQVPESLEIADRRYTVQYARGAGLVVPPEGVATYVLTGKGEGFFFDVCRSLTSALQNMRKGRAKAKACDRFRPGPNNDYETCDNCGFKQSQHKERVFTPSPWKNDPNCQLCGRWKVSQHRHVTRGDGTLSGKEVALCLEGGGRRFFNVNSADPKICDYCEHWKSKHLTDELYCPE